MQKIILIIGITLAYLLIINFIANNINFITPSLEPEEEFTNPKWQKIKVGGSVSASVFRPRWYGNIVENDKNSKLYFLEFIPIPLKSQDISFIEFHFIFLILISIIYCKDAKNK